MGAPRAVIFDVGNVLVQWDRRNLYGRLIADDRALDAFLDEVLTLDWHFQHDQGRDFAETSAELIAAHPAHADLIALWGPRFQESMGPFVAGMPELVAELDAAGVPIFGITNFSHEFWPAFRAAREDLFGRFGGIVVSGDEKIWKPMPEIYRLALDRFGLAADEALFVDDSLKNVAGAEAVGMHAHHFTGADRLRAELVGYGLLSG